MRTTAPLIASIVVAGVLWVGCDARSWGRPRIEVQATSPSGSHVAYVRNHVSIDPPNQSLWLRDLATGKRTKLKQLGEDMNWSNLVTWSVAGEAVAFLIDDAWVAVYDRTGAEVALGDLVPRDGYPTLTAVRDLRFAADARFLEFTACHRHTGRDCQEHTAGLEELSFDQWPSRSAAAASLPDAAAAGTP